MAIHPAASRGMWRLLGFYSCYFYCFLLVDFLSVVVRGSPLSMKVVRHSNGSTFFVSWNDRKSHFRSIFPIHRSWYDEVDEVHGVPDSVIESLPWREELVENKATGKSNAPVCPCTGLPGAQRVETPVFSSSLHSTASAAPRLCIVENRYSRFLRPYSSPHVHLVFVPYRTQYSSTVRSPSGTNHSQASSCAMVVHVLPEHRISKHFCPETCKPVPIVRLSWQWLTSTLHAVPNQTHSLPNATLVTCSLTLSQLHRMAQVWASTPPVPPVASQEPPIAPPLYLLLLLLLRRQQECSEPREWLRMLAPTVGTLREVSSPLATWEVWSERALYSPPRRNVKSLWLSIGSLSRHDLQTDQFSILRHHDGRRGPATVAGWSATEEIYDCVAENRCAYVSTDKQYMAYMPRTGMPDAPPGWACAQQRTLRALVHVLKLYDPDYVFVLDDDTFVSKYIAFHPALDTLLEEHIVHRNAVLGGLQLADRDVTREGFYWGGSGLLIGRAALDRLRSTRISASRHENQSRRDRLLSIHGETLRNANELCPSCIVSQTPHSLLAAVSLLEVCSNLMAYADTCYHSDHAVSRCLAHGSHSAFLSAHCTDKRRFFGDSRLSFGMCYPYDVCRPGEHLTCHRFRVNRSDEYNAFSLDETDRISTNFVPVHTGRLR